MKPAWKYLLPLTVFLTCLFPNLHSQAPANFNFELSTPGSYSTANAVTGWTVESTMNSMSFGGLACNASNNAVVWAPGSPEFSVLSTPISSLAFVGTVQHSPLGGNKVVQLNNHFPTGLATRIRNQFMVSATFNLFQIAFAGLFDGAHPCCEQGAFQLDFYTCTANPSLISSLSRTLNPPNAQCLSAASPYSVTSSVLWTNWQLFQLDLSPFIGQCLQVRVTVSDCPFGGHAGATVLDFGLSNSLLAYNPSIPPITFGNAVSFCSGSNIAVLQGPLGYSSYQWIAPGGFPIPSPLGISPNYTVNGAIPTSVWTLQVTQNGSITPLTYTILPSQVSIIGVSSGSSCIGGNSGSATVVANGSGSGYNYIWLNSGSVTVGTGSTVSGLASGIYTILVSSISGSACGTASSTISIGTQPAGLTQVLFKPYCNTEAYFCAGAGSNFQWYNGTVAIAPPLGTAQCYTLSNPTNGNFVYLKYSTAQSCQDSIQFVLQSSTPGNISITTSTYACQGSSNGSVTVSLSPAPGAGAQNTFSVFSLFNSPVYSASIAAGPQTSLALGNLPAGTFSVVSFDGSCKYGNTFGILSFADTFTLSPSTHTICSGQLATAGVTHTANPSPGQYTYSWSPSYLLAGSNQQSTILWQNTPAPGSLNTVVFTVVVTPSIINCPMSKTMAITWANPITPSIVPIPTLCSNSPNHTISVMPNGGSFMNAPAINSLTGVLTPSLANIGLNSFVYDNSVGPCLASASASFNIGGPSISFSGNTLVCTGQSGIIFANGANSYTWNTGANSNSISISPTMNTVYTATGSHTLDLCTSTRTVLVQNINPPSILISGNTSICSMTNGTLLATGANTYTWSNSAIGSTVSVSPFSNTIYTVSGSNILPNCIGHQTVLVIANFGPEVQIFGDTLLCLDAQGVIITSGANSYTWSASPSTWTNSSNSSTLIVNQAVSTLYTLTASSFSNPCITTRTLLVSVFPCTSVGEIASESSINISPNPSSGIFTIESPRQIEIKVYNALGQIILCKTLSPGKQTMDLYEQVSGIYFMTYKTNGISRVVRLVKQE